MQAPRVTVARSFAGAGLPRAWSRKAYDRATRYAGVGMFGAAGASSAAMFATGPGGGGGLTAPTWINAGTGSDVLSAGSITPAYPATGAGAMAAGDLIIMAGVSYATAIDTPSGWTLIYGPDTLGSNNNYIFARDARATGSESGTVTFTLTGDRANGRMYAFRNCAGTTATDPFEAHATASGSGAITNPSVTRGAAGRLVCACWMGFTTTPSVTPGGSPSGGTWTERAEFDGVNDIFVQELQTAGDVDISGGTTTFGGTNSGFCHAFALIGV